MTTINTSYRVCNCSYEDAVKSIKNNLLNIRSIGAKQLLTGTLKVIFTAAAGYILYCSLLHATRYATHQKTQNLQNLGINNENVNTSCISREHIVETLSAFNEKYRVQEQRDPREGYLVQFDDRNCQVQASLHPRGGRRNSILLSGIAEASDSCVFCPEQLAKNPNKLSGMTRRVTTDAVKSLGSGQLLIVPKDHYSQWFDAPVELQADLLQEAIEKREQYPESKKRPIELHCGLAAEQTVFHIHVRTGIHMA